MTMRYLSRVIASLSPDKRVPGSRSPRLLPLNPPRRWWCTRSAPLKSHQVCVIGSGPAGFYVAQHLLKLRKSVNVDIYEKLPVPFGLVRYGVAPDHPEVKNVTNTFTGVLQNERVRFVGNVEAGKHVSLQQLLEHYHAIVLCYGATSDNLLGIPNESLVTSAREFVGWYNGLPYNSNLRVDLSRTKKAVIIGHGNVALDIGRILLTPTTKLAQTDIAEYALTELQKSSVEEVVVVGRRGVLNVAFTIKEFREMVKLEHVNGIVDLHGCSIADINTDELPRPRKRLTDLILKSNSDNANGAKTHPKSWVLKFLRSPVSVSKLDSGRLSVKFEINEMSRDNKPVGTGEFEDIECDVVFRSIGYKGVQLFPELPFDAKAGVIANDRGRVSKSVYCSGWAGQGPRGVILSTMQNSFEVAKLVNEDIESGVIESSPKMGFTGVLNDGTLADYTSYSDYSRIAEWEKTNGRKITNVDHMLRICRGE